MYKKSCVSYRTCHTIIFIIKQLNLYFQKILIVLLKKGDRRGVEKWEVNWRTELADSAWNWNSISSPVTYPDLINFDRIHIVKIRAFMDLEQMSGCK